MLNKIFATRLASDYKKHEEERRKIISVSNAILHEAKRTIFSLHRNDLKTATQTLAEIVKQTTQLQKHYGTPRLAQEGAYSAAMEELAEAHFFYLASTGKDLVAIKGLTLKSEIYFGGLSDCTGELVRQAINASAGGDFHKALANRELINNIMTELTASDFTGYLRTKYDQAKNNIRKIEEVIYQLKINKLI
jgi:predicted translin family RNA/ssDNA-binding protein